MDQVNLLTRLQEHFSGDPAHLPVIQEDIDLYERPNLHLAFDELLNRQSVECEVIGVVDFDYEVSLARLSREFSAKEFDEGPVEFADVELADGKKMACVKQGVYFLKHDGRPVVLLVAERRHSYPAKIRLEAMASQSNRAEKFLRELTACTRQGWAYRGHVLSLEMDCYRSIRSSFTRCLK